MQKYVGKPLRVNCETIKDLGSIRAGAGSLLVPVFAYIFSYIFFGQIPTVLEIVGSVVTLVGVYITMVSS